MIYITDVGDGIRVEGEEVSRHYPYVGILTIPKNSTLVIIDEKSEMVVFKSSANYDTWFTGILGSIYIEGELVTRDNIVEKFNEISNVLPKGSGGGGMSDECCSTLTSGQDEIKTMIQQLSILNDVLYIDGMIDEINGEEINCG